jgi:aspartate/methionine/tyrosine aminotransferase
MRRNILHAGVANLKYEIREIVGAGNEIRALGQELTWDNIGDPVAKGEAPPEWIRDIVAGLLDIPSSWAYCETRGVPHVREFLANEVNRRDGARVTAEDIIFFNGLGDAVAKVYGFLSREARVLGPSPAYSTHSSAEAAHSGYGHVTYELDPYNGWMPDLDDIRNKVKYNDSIAGILLLSPDNPTGAVYPRDVLEEIAEIARENDIFIVADEIYANIVYDGRGRLYMSEWIGDVPGIAMRGISKEYPWPGARCGWLEVLNKGRDRTFAKYVDSLVAAKRLEVSSTTLPQMSIPLVMGDPRYPGHLDARERMFAARADEVAEAFAGCEHVVVNKPRGAFYYTVMFKPGVLRNDQVLPIENPR